jgi:hypothetical protein
LPQIWSLRQYLSEEKHSEREKDGKRQGREREKDRERLVGVKEGVPLSPLRASGRPTKHLIPVGQHEEESISLQGVEEKAPCLGVEQNLNAVPPD